MRHANKKKGRDKTATTIALCLCLIALTSIFTVKASIDKVQENARDLPVTQNTSTAMPQSEETVQKEEAEQAKEDEDAMENADLPVSKETLTVDSLSDDEKATQWISPINTETASVLTNYSMDMVIYNKTLDQYMTHPGIDFEAPSGSGVNAIANGTVTAAYDDDMYGASIEITHDGGIVSKYACLESESMVEEGDVVTQGQRIGTVGKTALYESLDPHHLHFEIYQNGTLCNPADYITME